MTPNSKRGRPVKYKTERDLYVADMESEIASDAGKASYTPAQWRAFYRAEVTEDVDYDITMRTLYKELGLTKGKAVMDTLASTDSHLAELLEQGESINSNDPGFDALAASMVSGSVITQAEADKLLALRSSTGVRSQIRGLPKPREIFFTLAIEAINAS